MKEIVEKRLQTLRAAMEERGLDGLWIESRENHLYACGYDNPDGALLITTAGAFAFQDFRYIEAAQREIPAELYEVIMPERPRKEWLPALLSAGGVHTVGYEDGTLSCRGLENLKKDCPGVTFSPIGEMLREKRCVKDAYEIDCIEKAQRIAEAAFAELLPRITYTAT